MTHCQSNVCVCVCVCCMHVLYVLYVCMRLPGAVFFCILCVCMCVCYVCLCVCVFVCLACLLYKWFCALKEQTNKIKETKRKKTEKKNRKKAKKQKNAECDFAHYFFFWCKKKHTGITLFFDKHQKWKETHLLFFVFEPLET